MLTSGRNRNAETAYVMAMKLLNDDTSRSDEVWDECFANTELQDLVSVYLYSTPEYAPMALYKIHTKLMELFGNE